MEPEMGHAFDLFFNPRSVVVAGASNNLTTMGTIQLLNILHGGFTGKIFCLHPTESSVLGLPTFKKPAELPETPDLAFLVLPSRFVPGLIDELGAKGVKAAIVISGGFRESGSQAGIELERALLEAARRHGMRLVGPNCIGVISPPARFNTTVAPYVGEPGRVAFLSQSGTYVTQVLGFLYGKGWGFSRAVSMGNSADLNMVDGLDYLAEDDATGAIALYIEGLPDGRAFMKAAARAALKKPVVALYVGGSETGARASASHTGALAGSGDVHAGAFRQAGVVQVHTIEDLYAAAHALSHQPPMRGPRVAVITNSGGPAASIADSISTYGLQLPLFSAGLQEKIKGMVPKTGTVRNPVDITFDLDTEGFLVGIVDMVLGSGEVDALVIHGVIGSLYLEALAGVIGDRMPMDNSPLLEVYREAITRSMGVMRKHGLPVVISAFWGREDSSVRMFHDGGIPCHGTPESAVRTLRAMYERGLFETRGATL
jgi:acetyltransferase